jgi:sporulation protein YlmC with PRC-barrel domain
MATTPAEYEGRRMRHHDYRRVLAADTLQGDTVRNPSGEDLGKIESIMIDIPTGRVAYAVLSYGGFLGMGNKLFAVPWDAFNVDEQNHEFILDIAKDRLEDAPGFDKDHWPDMADPDWAGPVHDYYSGRDTAASDPRDVINEPLDRDLEGKDPGRGGTDRSDVIQRP